MAQRDDQLQQILSRLTSIAQALVTDIPPPRTPPTPEQAATILDYLVLREVVGRRADETSRVVGATRLSGRQIEFVVEPPIEDDTRFAVFTARGTPAEIGTFDDDGDEPDVGVKRTIGDERRRKVTLRNVADSQPIIRIEIRRADDLAIALGPRLEPVVTE